MDTTTNPDLQGDWMTRKEARQILVNIIKRDASDEHLIGVMEDFEEVNDAAWDIWYDYDQPQRHDLISSLRAALQAYVVDLATE